MTDYNPLPKLLFQHEQCKKYGKYECFEFHILNGGHFGYCVETYHPGGILSRTCINVNNIDKDDITFSEKLNFFWG